MMTKETSHCLIPEPALSGGTAAAHRTLRRELMSPHGDAITLLGVFEEWVRLKAGGRGSTARWCK